MRRGKPLNNSKTNEAGVHKVFWPILSSSFLKISLTSQHLHTQRKMPEGKRNPLWLHSCKEKRTHCLPYWSQAKTLPAPLFPAAPVAPPHAFQQHLIHAGASVTDALAHSSYSQGVSCQLSARQSTYRKKSAFPPWSPQGLSRGTRNYSTQELKWTDNKWTHTKERINLISEGYNFYRAEIMFGGKKSL